MCFFCNALPPTLPMSMFMDTNPLHNQLKLMITSLLYKAEKLSVFLSVIRMQISQYSRKAVCLSVCLHFLARRYLSNVSVNWNKTCLKSNLCLWGSRNLFLQAYRTHHLSTGVRKRLRSRQPLSVKHEAGGSSPTIHVFYYS